MFPTVLFIVCGIWSGWASLYLAKGLQVDCCAALFMHPGRMRSLSGPHRHRHRGVCVLMWWWFVAVVGAWQPRLLSWHRVLQRCQTAVPKLGLHYYAAHAPFQLPNRQR